MTLEYVRRCDNCKTVIPQSQSYFTMDLLMHHYRFDGSFHNLVESALKRDICFECTKTFDIKPHFQSMIMQQ